MRSASLRVNCDNSALLGSLTHWKRRVPTYRQFGEESVSTINA